MKKILLIAIVALAISQVRAQVTVALGSAYEVEAGTKVYIPVTVTGLDLANGGTPITAAEFHVFYNNLNVGYDTTANISTLTLPGEWIYGASSIEYGSSWIDDNLNPLSFPDGTVLFEIVFDYYGGATQLDLDSVRCILVDANFNQIPVAQVIDGVITPAPGSDQSVWNGNGNWTTAANWSNGVPGINTIAIIESGNTEISSNANCKSMTVNASCSVRVMPGFALSISEGITNNGIFTIESDATGTGSVISNGSTSGTGTYTTEQFVDFSLSGVHLISSPLPVTNADVFSGMSPEEFTESTASWQGLGSGETLANAQGIRVTSGTTSTLVFNGPFNSTSVSLSNPGFSASNTDEFKGLNLIGNPFPSALIADVAAWDKSGAGNGVYIWDDYRYKCWNGSIGSLTDGIIPAMQGFMVRADNVGANLVIPSSSRIHSNVPLYKKSNENESNLLVFSLRKKDEPEYFDEAFIHVKAGTINDYSSESDVIKLLGDPSYPQIFSLSTDSKQLAINTQPDFENSIPLVLKSGTAGKYQLIVSGIESINPEIPLYLEDKLDPANIWDFRFIQNIEFDLAAGISTNNRYVLHFKTVGINDPDTDSFKVFADNGLIYIQSENQKRLEQVELFSVSGSLLGSCENLTTPTVIRSEKCSGGIAILRIRTTEGIFIKKVIL